MYGIIKLIAFLSILIVSITILSNITKRKLIWQRTEDFKAQNENFDVLFFGTSQVMNGIFPMQLWNDYGIISYNLGNHAERMTMTYYNMVLALEETKPKLVVVDALATYDTDKLETISHICIIRWIHIHYPTRSI